MAVIGITTRRSALVVLPLAVCAGCGSGDPCAWRSPCRNDPPPSPASINQCLTQKALTDDPCYGAFIAFVNCQHSSVVCSADGTTDAARTGGNVEDSCTSERSQGTRCCTRNLTSRLCT